MLRNWPLYKPVIAAVNGFCTAGGMEMLGGCDIRVACPEAKFAVMEPKRGLFAGGGTTVRLPRQIPWPQAMEFLLCADLIPAERAYEMGLLNAIVPRDQLLDKAREYAARMIANAPLAVQATKESALKGLYVDEDAITQVREAARALRAALEQIDAADPATAQGAIAASVEVLDQARQGAAHRVREGEPHLERDLPDRGRQGRPAGVRREAQAGLDRRSERCDRSAHAVHHRGRARTRGIREDVGDAGAPEPLEMWEHVARLAERDAGKPGCSARSTASRSCTARRGSTTTRSRASRERLGADPRHRHYSGIGGTTTQQLVNGTSRSDAARRDGPRADHERRGAGHQAAAQAAGRALRRVVRARRALAVPVGVAARPDRGRARGVPGLAHVRACSTTPGAHVSASASTTYRAEIGEMLAPMTQIAARNPHAWYRVERTAAEIVDARPDNRMVGYPYTKYMVSVMDVDMAGALVARDARARRRARHPARSARVPARLVLRARSGARRRSTPTSRARRRWRAASAEALRVAGASVDDVALLRSLLVLRELAALRVRRARHRASTIRAGVTVTGGLPYHGGPASGYLTHSIAAMVERLRAEPEATGLVSGVGMHMTKHVFGVYWATPGPVAPPDAERRAGRGRPRRADRGRRRARRRRDGRRVLGRARSRRRARMGAARVRPPGGARTYAQVRDARPVCRRGGDRARRTHGDASTPRTVDGPDGHKPSRTYAILVSVVANVDGDRQALRGDRDQPCADHVVGRG